MHCWWWFHLVYRITIRTMYHCMSPMVFVKVQGMYMFLYIVSTVYRNIHYFTITYSVQFSVFRTLRQIGVIDKDATLIICVQFFTLFFYNKDVIPLTLHMPYIHYTLYSTPLWLQHTGIYCTDKLVK